MDPISLIFWILLFCILAYLAFWICDKAGFPPPVRWVVGVLFLIVLLGVVTGQLPHPPAINFHR
jgi:hypothetical protein